MHLDLDPPKFTAQVKRRTLEKPTAELEMIVRRWELDDHFWQYVFAKEELANREKLLAKKVGLMFYKEDR